MGGWSTEETLQPGSVISRYGGERGVFASPADTPFSARGLPPEVELQGENLYEVTQPIQARAGIAAWWLGGGGRHSIRASGKRPVASGKRTPKELRAVTRDELISTADRERMRPSSYTLTVGCHQRSTC